jgi:anhydro-N-acetylmuramic acid kinase
VKKLVKKVKQPVELIGFHGQTIFHAPPQTIQMGDGGLLARLTGIPVVYDFRRQDCEKGGQGAPLVPVYHQGLCATMPSFAEGPTAVLNIGGVANITYIDGDQLIAFDTGPGNALIDDFMMREMEQPYDLGGKIASFGKPKIDLLQQWLGDPYFQKPFPKSLDRDHFQYLLKEARGKNGGIDGLATLTAFTTFAVFHGLQKLPQFPKRVIVCGGGRKNQTILHWLRFLLKRSDVLLSDALGWDGDLLEAQAFGFLAVRSRQGLPLSFPGTTGVSMPTVGGTYVAVSERELE